MSNNIYETKLRKILDKYKNMNIYINDNIKSLTSKQTKVFKDVAELQSIPNDSIIITDTSSIPTKNNHILIILLSINDNLNTIIHQLNTTCIDIFSWHQDGKHDDHYFAIFQNE